MTRARVLAGLLALLLALAGCAARGGEVPPADAGPAAPGAAEPAAPDRDGGQVSLMDMGAAQAAERLRRTDVNTLTPIEAMNLLFELKQML